MNSAKLFVLVLSVTFIALVTPSLVMPTQPTEDRSTGGCEGSQNSQREPIPIARYSDQYVLGFTQNFTSIIYNVTATAQADNYGYGPAYLLDGLTDEMYWYQVGIAYNWTRPDGKGFVKGFSFLYQVWNSDGTAVYPESGHVGIQEFSGSVGVGDLVELSLNFSGGSVTMSAFDWNTSSTSTQLFPAKGSHFAGSAGPSYFFTGLMTEWYHAGLEVCGAKPVHYSSDSIVLRSGWMCVDRWNFPSTLSSGRITFSVCSQASPYDGGALEFSTHGISIRSNSHGFVTP